MNPKPFLLALGLPLICSLSIALAADVDQTKLKEEAIGIVKKFGGSLKPELKKAIQAGGPAHAIAVCSDKAPEIAKNLSDETGWKVKRVGG